MKPQIIEKHSEKIANVSGIVKRIIEYVPQNLLSGLDEIVLMENHSEDRAFACYNRAERRIEIYLDSILEWQPWIFKKTYIFPYLTIGMALGHELDHHVNRNNKSVDKEKNAETNALRYIYPSRGIFKPLVRLMAFILRKK